MRSDLAEVVSRQLRRVKRVQLVQAAQRQATPEILRLLCT